MIHFSSISIAHAGFGGRQRNRETRCACRSASRSSSISSELPWQATFLAESLVRELADRARDRVVLAQIQNLLEQGILQKQLDRLMQRVLSLLGVTDDTHTHG
jgi:hypothetical protein